MKICCQTLKQMAPLTDVSFSDDSKATAYGQANNNCQVGRNTANGNYDRRCDAEATIARLVLCFRIQVSIEVFFYQHLRKIKFKTNA